MNEPPLPLGFPIAPQPLAVQTATEQQQRLNVEDKNIAIRLEIAMRIEALVRPAPIDGLDRITHRLAEADGKCFRQPGQPAEVDLGELGRHKEGRIEIPPALGKRHGKAPAIPSGLMQLHREQRLNDRAGTLAIAGVVAMEQQGDVF